MNVRRLLVTGLGLLLLALLLVLPVSSSTRSPEAEPSLPTVRAWSAQVLILVAGGLTVSAVLVSVLHAGRRVPVAEPAVDHDA